MEYRTARLNCEEKKSTGKFIKYLLFCTGESMTTLPVEHPSPDASSASVQCVGPAPGLAVLPQSARSPTPSPNSGGISVVTCCQCPTAKVKVEAGIGMVT